MKTILEDGKPADFTLKLGDREWPVHKVILESRCEYFANMFRQNWIKNTVGLVKFNDIKEDVLDSVLHFIYTGVVKDMTVKNVCDICVAAYKFLLNDLKELCIEYIKESMCVEIVCRVIVIANTYNSKDLNECAIVYFTQETTKVLDSKQWKELKKNHQSIVIKLLEEIAMRNFEEDKLV